MSEFLSNPGQKPKATIEKLQKFIGLFKYRVVNDKPSKTTDAVLDAIADKFDIGKDYPEFKGWELIGFHRGLGREFWQASEILVAPTHGSRPSSRPFTAARPHIRGIQLMCEKDNNV
jgi:hypothetical protein